MHAQECCNKRVKWSKTSWHFWCEKAQLQYAKLFKTFLFEAWICDFICYFWPFYVFESDPYEPNVPKLALIITHQFQSWRIDPMANMVNIFVGI